MLEELLTVFEYRYGTDLSFLHEPTFFTMLLENDVYLLAPSRNPLLLAFMALAVPCHEPISALLTPYTPPQACQWYAGAAESRITQMLRDGIPNLEVTQALLMLGYIAHGLKQGNKSYFIVGHAITCMQLLRCHRDAGLDDRPFKIGPFAQKSLEAVERATPTGEALAILNERKRRTFWSCYIMDQYTSGGIRPHRICIEETLVQLPCAEEDFYHGYQTKTMMLRETPEAFRARRAKHTRSISNEAASDDAAESVEWDDDTSVNHLVWFLKALDLQQDVLDWVCNTTRRNEETAPWEQGEAGGMTYYKLNERLTDLTNKLPPVLILDAVNTDIHITHNTIASYVQLHSALALCEIALQRDWLSYLPDPKSGPEGPTDGPNLDQYLDAPPTFWKDSASKCFKAVKGIFDLNFACKDLNVPIGSPFTTFVMYIVVHTTMWSIFYPNMDHEGILTNGKSRSPNMDHDSSLSNGPSSEPVFCCPYERFCQGYAILHKMQSSASQGRPWCKAIRTLHKEIQEVQESAATPTGGTNAASSSSSPTTDPSERQACVVCLDKRLKVSIYFDGIEEGSEDEALEQPEDPPPSNGKGTRRRSKQVGPRRRRRRAVAPPSNVNSTAHSQPAVASPSNHDQTRYRQLAIAPPSNHNQGAYVQPAVAPPSNYNQGPYVQPAVTPPNYYNGGQHAVAPPSYHNGGQPAVATPCNYNYNGTQVGLEQRVYGQHAIASPSHYNGGQPTVAPPGHYNEGQHTVAPPSYGQHAVASPNYYNGGQPAVAPPGNYNYNGTQVGSEQGAYYNGGQPAVAPSSNYHQGAYVQSAVAPPGNYNHNGTQPAVAPPVNHNYNSAQPAGIPPSNRDGTQVGSQQGVQGQPAVAPPGNNNGTQVGSEQGAQGQPAVAPKPVKRDPEDLEAHQLFSFYPLDERRSKWTPPPQRCASDWYTSMIAGIKEWIGFE
ncbi:hypothetical protein N0V90_012822 [Kalmusia sp. IMI 367209]|nr:hypothetical protein N0V90_012822 [Kalmusia sp. IMI 367209]